MNEKAKLILFELKNDLVRKRNSLAGTINLQVTEDARARIKAKVDKLNEKIAEIDQALEIK